MIRIKKVGDENWEKGYRNLIMRIILTSGGISHSAIELLGVNVNTFRKKMKKMEEEGTLTKMMIGSKRGKRKYVYRLNDFEGKSDRYIDYFPNFYGHYISYAKEGSATLGRVASQKSLAYKSYREVEAVMMMYQTSIRIFPDEKVRAYVGDEIPLYPPSFYNTLEMKREVSYQITLSEDEKKSKKIVQGRGVGVVISEGGIYVVLHVENENYGWSNKGERSSTYFIREFVNKKCVKSEDHEYYERSPKESVEERPESEREKEVPYKIPIVNEAILIGDSNNIFKEVFECEKGNMINVYGEVYKKIYMLPKNENGQYMMEFMTREDWREDMKNMCVKNAKSTPYENTVNCDVILNDRYILLFCIPDLVKLKKFLSNAIGDDQNIEKYSVYCFDFQKEFLQTVLDERIEIKTASFKRFCEVAKIKLRKSEGS